MNDPAASTVPPSHDLMMEHVDFKERVADPSQRSWIRGAETFPPDTADVPWSTLTRSPDKIQAYRLDSEFRIVWDELRRSDAALRTALLEECGLLLFKPEALLTDVLGEALRLCERMGFRVCFLEDTRLDPSKFSLLWRYQLNNATVDRLRAVLTIFGERPCLVALVTRARGPGQPPTCIALSRVKGSAFSARRDPQTLRGVFGCPNPVISFVHVGDEPADMVRDLGILLDWPQRRRLYAAVSARATVDVAAVAAAARERSGRYDFDPRQAVARLRTALETTATRRDPQRAALDALARAEAFEEYLDAWAFLQDLEASGAVTDPSDRMLAVTTFVLRLYDGTRHLLHRPQADDWDTP